MKIKKITHKTLETPEDIYCLTVNDSKHQIVLKSKTSALIGSQCINFGFLFGGSWWVFQNTQLLKNGIKISEQDAKNARTAFMSLYKVINAHVEATKKEFFEPKTEANKTLTDSAGNTLSIISSHVKEISSLFGRRICVDTANKALNYPVQSSGGDMIKLAACIFEDACEKRNLDAYIVNYIHDDVVIEGSISQKEEILKVFANAMNTAANAAMGKHFLTDVTEEIIVLAETPAEVC
jgi:DNA polymerase I-like protein with 3'-5' exonuclease and polymerase domains